VAIILVAEGLTNMKSRTACSLIQEFHLVGWGERGRVTRRPESHPPPVNLSDSWLGLWLISNAFGIFLAGFENILYADSTDLKQSEPPGCGVSSPIFQTGTLTDSGTLSKTGTGRAKVCRRSIIRID
jgi:hypothetical protein